MLPAVHRRIFARISSFLFFTKYVQQQLVSFLCSMLSTVKLIRNKTQYKWDPVALKYVIGEVRSQCILRNTFILRVSWPDFIGISTWLKKKKYIDSIFRCSVTRNFCWRASVIYKRIHNINRSFEPTLMKFTRLVRVWPRMNLIVFGNNRPCRTNDIEENVPPKTGILTYI